MARRGRRPSLVITLDGNDRELLERCLRSTIIPAGKFRRVRLILLLSEGRSHTESGRMAGISRRHVYKWIKRFIERGVAGLEDIRVHRARRRKVPDSSE